MVFYPIRGAMGANEGVADRLGEWYRMHIGEPESELDLYTGFALFFGGVALGLAGLALFAVEQVLTAETVFWVREIAYGIGALGLPALLLGVTVLLPVDRRATYAAAAGAAVTVLAVAFFVAVYPSQWNVSGPDYSLHGVVLYAVGLSTVVAATAAALVSYHVERATVPGEGAGPDDGPEVTDEQVRRDIEEVTAKADLSWGGVPDRETRRLEVRTDEVADVDRSTFDRVGGQTHRSEGVDDAVSGLCHLRGGEERTARGGGTDDQAQALTELRRARSQSEEPGGLLARLRRRLGV